MHIPLFTYIEVGGGEGAIEKENLRWGAEALRVLEAVPSPVVAWSSVFLGWEHSQLGFRRRPPPSIRRPWCGGAATAASTRSGDTTNKIPRNHLNEHNLKGYIC